MTRENSSREQVAQQIENSVRSRMGGRIHGLAVHSAHDRVILTGSTSEYYHKQLATRAAQDVSASERLNNDIQVVRNLHENRGEASEKTL